VPLALVDRSPTVAPDRLLSDLSPPPRFAAESFATYRPDPAEASQREAVERLAAFAETVGRGSSRSWWGRREPDGPTGVYLDGGFGVGKTHLLAALWQAVHGAGSHALFATFVEITHLVGALGFADTVERLSTYRLICVDEFELDDPGDTVLVSTLLTRLTEAGVRVAATSNTLPGRLGQGRFAAQDFLREIQSLAERFEVIRVEGEDYRHRGLPEAPAPVDDHRLRAQAAARPDVALDDFDALCQHLASLHPSRYGALLDGVHGVCWSQVRTLSDQAVGLRLVVLADRLYDRSVPLSSTGVPLDQLFAAELLTGGYRKKYSRAISRLVALSRESTAADG
jgi:cell division protein ZapE